MCFNRGNNVVPTWRPGSEVQPILYVCSSIRTCAVYIGASRQCDYDDYDLPSTSWVCLPTLNLSFWQNEAITETLFKIILGEEEGLKIGKDLIFFFVLSGG